MDLPSAIGSFGVAVLLLAFFLDQHRRRLDRRAYAAMNLVGAGLACYASWLIGFLPFVVLEGTWAAVAGAFLLRALTGARG